MTRIKIRKERMLAGLKADKESARFGTPLSVAEYRAQRLKCNALLEIGASVGFQTYAFAQTCRKVYAIEINRKKFELLERNMSSFSNVKLIHGDALNEKILRNLRKKDIDSVFVDTERPEFETARSLEGVKPNILRILDAYGQITQNVGIEVPPQIRSFSLKNAQQGFGRDKHGALECEREYISLYNKLNRLTLYFGGLKKCEASVVFLPKIRGNKDYEAMRGDAGEIDYIAEDDAKRINAKFIYEVNPAVVRAGLLHYLLAETRAKAVKVGSRPLLFSNVLAKHPALKPYKIIKKTAIPVKVGKVVLKGSVNPSDYKILKNKFEHSSIKAGIRGRSRLSKINSLKTMHGAPAKMHCNKHSTEKQGRVHTVFATPFGYFICYELQA